MYIPSTSIILHSPIKIYKIILLISKPGNLTKKCWDNTPHPRPLIMCIVSMKPQFRPININRRMGSEAVPGIRPKGWVICLHQEPPRSIVPGLHDVDGVWEGSFNVWAVVTRIKIKIVFASHVKAGIYWVLGYGFIRVDCDWLEKNFGRHHKLYLVIYILIKEMIISILTSRGKI